MTHEEKWEKMVKWVEDGPEYEGDMRDLAEALYSASELGMFGGMYMDADGVIELWKICEAVRMMGFPDELKM